MEAQATECGREPAGFVPDDATAGADQSPAPNGGSRALVPIQPVEPGLRPRPGRYPSATFLAQLIAVDRRLPQMRRRGRAAPADAVAVYAATLRHQPARPGRKLHRSA